MLKFITIEECLNYYISHKSFSSFYPTAVLKQVEGSTIPELYEMCEKYKSEGKLQELFEIRCPECFDILGTYEYYADIPEELECIKCGCENIKRAANVCVLYKIIR